MRRKPTLCSIIFLLLCALLCGCAESVVPPSAPDESFTDISGFSKEEPQKSFLEFVSGDSSVEPSKGRLWAESYNANTDQWSYSEGATVDERLKLVSYDKLPLLYKDGKIEMACSDEYTLVDIRLFNEIEQEITPKPETLDDLNDLEVGKWIIAATVEKQENYIEKHDRYTTSCNSYFFSLCVMPEGMQENSQFCGTVKEIIGDSLMVAPFAGGFEYQYSIIDVYVGDTSEYEAGDRIRVEYDGLMLEVDPPRPQQIYKVKKLLNREMFVTGEVAFYPAGCLRTQKTYDNGEWTIGCGNSYKYMLEYRRDKIPDVKKYGDISIYTSDNGAEYTVKIFDPETMEQMDIPEDDLAVLNKLTDGEYIVVIERYWCGEFIESFAKHPRENYETYEEFYEANRYCAEEYSISYDIFKLIIQ